MDTQSDAPEASLAIQGSASEHFGANSVTKNISSVKIKKEKFAKSG
uniref:Uncharacterized protein n=1 Tax=Brassica campestris TaxID=3711 RepID=A0A3P6ADK3_BRACM|nr:unnamed protein product [Brassica rapa]